MTFRLVGQSLRLGTTWPSQNANRVVVSRAERYEPFDSGPLQVTGTTKIVGAPATPVRRRVRLHDLPTGRLLRETWSDATTGAYTFDRLRAGPYYVTAFDHTGQYGGVIETHVVAEPVA